LTIVTVTVWPLSAPVVVPVMAKPTAALAALTVLSPPIRLLSIAIVGAMVSRVKLKLLAVETLPTARFAPEPY
jgi:hypothetical protein